jgi:hypothetical protein
LKAIHNDNSTTCKNFWLFLKVKDTNFESNSQLKGSWYSTYDETGRKIKDAAVSSLGDFRNASGSTIIFKKGSWIGTYDKTFKKLSERAG